MKTYGGMDVWIHVFLISALVGGEWSASRPARFAPGYPLDRRAGGPQNRSGRRGVKKNLALTRTPTLRPSSPQPVAIPTIQTAIYRLLVPCNVVNIVSNNTDGFINMSYNWP
jgi:hypothetical protein